MALPVLAQGNLDFSLGNGLTAASADGQYRMAMGGSVQLLGTSVWDAQGRGMQAYPSLGFMRLQGSARPESVEFLVQLNFAQATPLLDAWVRHTTRWGSRITVGQMQMSVMALKCWCLKTFRRLRCAALRPRLFRAQGAKPG